VTVILLFVVVLASYVCVRIGAVAFELTGIPWERAKFQALSAFTNCGYTTSEAEDIVRHPLRRRIASTLIILGNAGIVTTMGTFASTLVGTNLRQALTNVGIIALGISVLAAIARLPFFSQKIRYVIQRSLAGRFDFAPTAEAMLRFDEGYCLTRLKLPDDSPAIGVALKDLRLQERLIQILAIERGADFRPIPRGEDRLLAGDILIIYGTEDIVEEIFHPNGTQRITVMVEGLHVSDTAAARRGSVHDG
jgi:hypothetical protein